MFLCMEVSIADETVALLCTVGSPCQTTLRRGQNFWKDHLKMQILSK